MITEHKPKVVHFNEWKENKSMQTYLKVLSFNQLINESNTLVEQLKINPISPSLTNKASFILKEIKHRLHYHSPEMSSALHNLNAQLISYE